MKKKMAEKWVEALRSGKYKQGRGALKYKTKSGVVRHCCLGVLCELYQKSHKRKLRADCDPGKYDFVGSKVFSFDDSDGCLPDKVIKWSGMDSEEGYVSGKSCLASMNDEDLYDFKMIAEFIEKEYEKL